jgi:hypothetical protein
MNTTRMPGFLADASLYNTSGRYQSVANGECRSGEQRVVSQMRVGGGGGFGGFGGLRLGFWCEAGCGLAYAACLAACGSLTGPAAPVCAGACTGLWRACTDGC